MSRIIYNIRDMKGGGIVDNGYTKRIRERVLSLEDGTVFVMSDFADIADTSTIRQSLSRLVQSGTLRRILKGVYEKPKYSKLLDECGGRPGSGGERIGTKLSLDDCPMWEYSIEPVRSFNTGNSSMVLYQRWSI